MWNDFLTQLTPQMWQAVWVSTYETVYISFASTFLAVIVGLPFGVLTFLTGKGEILQKGIQAEKTDDAPKKTRRARRGK